MFKIVNKYFEKRYRHKWYLKMIERKRGEYQGLMLAQAVGLSEKGKMMVKRFHKHMLWLDACKDGKNPFNVK